MLKGIASHWLFKFRLAVVELGGYIHVLLKCVADVCIFMLFSSGFSSAAEEWESNSLESFTEEHRASLQEHQCCSERPNRYVQKRIYSPHFRDVV